MWSIRVPDFGLDETFGILYMQAGQAPFMSKIAIPKLECLLCAVNGGTTGEGDTNPVFSLILRKYFIYCNGDKFSGSVTEPEPHWCDFSVCVGT